MASFVFLTNRSVDSGNIPLMTNPNGRYWRTTVRLPHEGDDDEQEQRTLAIIYTDNALHFEIARESRAFATYPVVVSSSIVSEPFEFLDSLSAIEHDEFERKHSHELGYFAADIDGAYDELAARLASIAV